MENSFQEHDFDDGTAPEALNFLSRLEGQEGNETHLTQNEFASVRDVPSFRARLWSLIEPADPSNPAGRVFSGSSLVGLGVYQCTDTPELFTACLPDHREMSLFLPMLQWADALAAETHPTASLTVWAWEHDICTPYLLLRLNFKPGRDRVQRGDEERVPYLAQVGMVTALGQVDG